MSALGNGTRVALASLIRVAGETATMPDGSTVAGVLEPLDASETAMMMQGAINTAGIKAFTFRTLEMIPAGFRRLMIDDDVFDVAKSQRSQLTWTTWITQKETR